MATIQRATICWPEEKDRGSLVYECLHNISWQSIWLMLMHYSADQRGGSETAVPGAGLRAWLKTHQTAEGSRHGQITNLNQITNEPWKSEWSMPLGCVNMLSRGRILFNRCYKMHRSVFPQQWRRFSIFDDGCQTLVASLSALSRSPI